MLETTITVRGSNVDEAIEKGLRELGITRDQAEIHVISEGKRGFLGFGRQDAIVEVRRITDLSLKEITQKLEKIDELEETKTDSEIIEEVEEENVDVTELEEVAEKDQIEAIDQTEEETLVEEKTEEVAETEVTELSDEAEETSEAKETVDYDQLNQEVCDYLENVISAYGAKAKVSWTRESKKKVVFDIETEKSGLVIGRHGQIINALQTLAQVKINSLYHRHINVLLNVGDYRERRANILEQMADRTAKQVIKTKQPVILESLPAFERKQIHAHLAKVPYIKTHSEGREPNRYLVVEYKA